MRSLIALLIPLGLLALGSASRVRAQEAAPPAPAASVRADASVDFASSYVWRGQILNADPVLQPGLSATLNLPAATTLSLSWWGSCDLTATTGHEHRFTEHDWTGTLGFALGPVTVSAGVVEYYFPHTGGTDTDTQEAFAQLTLPLPAPTLLPTNLVLSGAYDFDEVRGAYAKASLQTGYELSPIWRLTAHADAGAAENNYNAAYFGPDENAWNDVAAGVALNAAIDTHTGAALALEYSSLLDANLDQAADERYGGGERAWLVARFSATF